MYVVEEHELFIRHAASQSVHEPAALMLSRLLMCVFLMTVE